MIPWATFPWNFSYENVRIIEAPLNRELNKQLWPEVCRVTAHFNQKNVTKMSLTVSHRIKQIQKKIFPCFTLSLVFERCTNTVLISGTHMEALPCQSKSDFPTIDAFGTVR